MKILPFFVGAPGRAHRLGGESPYTRAKNLMKAGLKEERAYSSLSIFEE